MLPTAIYQEVEFIESTGTQYINSGVVATHSSVDMIFQMTDDSVTGQGIFGARAKATVGTQSYNIYYNNSSNGSLRLDWLGRTVYHIIDTNTDVHLELRENGDVAVNGELYESTADKTTCAQPLYIFAQWGGTALTTTKARMKLMSLKIYSSGTLVRSFIPCYRKSDGVIGLYDDVNGEFYTNLGTGIFEKGEDIDPPAPPVPVVKKPRSNIEYVEIRSHNSRQIECIIDTAQSIIWHSVYFGCGDFEIYCRATDNIRNSVRIGDYVTRNNTDDVGVIESIERTFDADHGRMLIIKGRLGKILLSRRLIYQLTDNSNKATILSGNLEDAVRKVVSDNAIDSIDKNRNIPNLVLGAKNNLVASIEPKQTSYSNLMEYTDEILCEYDYASKVIFNRESSKLEFVVYEGEDHTTENKIIFSTDFDNLNASDYTEDYSDYKTVALVGGSGEGVDRFYALVGSAKGLNRREIFVDADSINKTYRDDDGTEHTYSDAEYEAMLTEEGSQTLYQHFYTDDFNGELNVQLSQWKLGIDYDLGDTVICDDSEIGLTTAIRITEITEVQDENGYNVEIKFEV